MNDTEIMTNADPSANDHDARIDAIPDIHGHAKGEHKPYAEERPIPYTARMLFLWFYHACRRGSPRYLMVADHMNYLTFEDPAAVNLVRRAIKLAAAGDLYGAAETAGVELQHAAVVSEGLRKGMRYSIGAEVDNDPRSRPDAQNIVDAMKPDGMIRSVHFLPITHPVHGEGWLWPFDNPEFADLYDHVGVERTWEIYMATLLDAVEKLPGHIVGHFYVPAKFGHWPDDETLERYEDQFLEAVKARGMSVEINARSFYRHAPDDVANVERYRAANLRLLRKAKAAGVGIAVGSDAHSPKDQGNGMADVLALLDEADVNVLTFPINGRLASVALRVTEDVLAQQRALAEAAAAAAAAASAAAAVRADRGDDDDEEADEAGEGRAPEVAPGAAAEATPAHVAAAEPVAALPTEPEAPAAVEAAAQAAPEPASVAATPPRVHAAKPKKAKAAKAAPAAPAEANAASEPDAAASRELPDVATAAHAPVEATAAVPAEAAVVPAREVERPAPVAEPEPEPELHVPEPVEAAIPAHRPAAAPVGKPKATLAEATPAAKPKPEVKAKPAASKARIETKAPAAKRTTPALKPAAKKAAAAKPAAKSGSAKPAKTVAKPAVKAASKPAAKPAAKPAKKAAPAKKPAAVKKAAARPAAGAKKKAASKAAPARKAARPTAKRAPKPAPKAAKRAAAPAKKSPAKAAAKKTARKNVGKARR